MKKTKAQKVLESEGVKFIPYTKSIEDKKHSRIFYQYGISYEQYLKYLKKQKGVCAICKETNKNKKLHIDHCHTTNKVRGLLCGKCNSGLGMFNDNIKLFYLSMQYLNKSQKTYKNEKRAILPFTKLILGGK